MSKNSPRQKERRRPIVRQECRKNGYSVGANNMREETRGRKKRFGARINVHVLKSIETALRQEAKERGIEYAEVVREVLSAGMEARNNEKPQDTL